jgi:pimeloyl-ACP methyl ester carboxylesterase
MLPGYMGSKEDFLPLLAPLAEAGFRAVAVDGRGQHESAGPEDAYAYAQAELTADVVAQAERLLGDQPLHLLGHSLGGLIARATVLDAARVPWASLTLMSSGPAGIQTDHRSMLKLLLDVLPTMGKEAVWREIRKLDERVVTPDVEEFLHRRWTNTAEAQLMTCGRHLIDEPDRTAELAAVQLPMLVISGTSDYAWPVECQDEMAAHLGAHRVVVEDSAHSPNVENPTRTARALTSFWTALPEVSGTPRKDSSPVPRESLAADELVHGRR